MRFIHYLGKNCNFLNTYQLNGLCQLKLTKPIAYRHTLCILRKLTLPHTNVIEPTHCLRNEREKKPTCIPILYTVFITVRGLRKYGLIKQIKIWHLWKENVFYYLQISSIGSTAGTGGIMGGYGDSAPTHLEEDRLVLWVNGSLPLSDMINHKFSVTLHDTQGWDSEEEESLKFWAWLVLELGSLGLRVSFIFMQEMIMAMEWFHWFDYNWFCIPLQM